MKNKTEAAILDSHARGDERLPCARLQCVEFDTAFYAKLLEVHDRQLPNPLPPYLQDSALNPAKRRKMSGTLKNE